LSLSRTRRAQRTLKVLREAIPAPETELRYETPYQLIVAVILSAQCTDKRVNKVTPALFDEYPTVEDMAEADPDDVYPFVKSVTYPNSKSEYLAGTASKIVDEFGGQVPETTNELQTLPGVGRKTANVVASVAYEVDALPVDTHVFRVANRIGLVEHADTPRKVERQLERVIPKDEWGEAHHLLILHGRYTCTARNPDCDDCPVAPVCRYFERLQRLPDPMPDLDARHGRYFCRSCDRYFDEPGTHTDRYELEQTACPRCDSMTVFDAKTGETTKRVLDFRID
jgi:endonuclease-3